MDTPESEAPVWKILNRAAERSQGDEQLALDYVQASLEELSAADLAAYAATFANLRDSLIGSRLYALLYLLNGVWDDEAVIDLASWILLQGEPTYRAALANLDSLVNLVDPDRDDYGVVSGEALAFMPYQIYEEAMGEELPFPEGMQLPETAFDEKITPEDPAQMQQLFPEIWAKLGGYHEKCFEKPPELTEKQKQKAIRAEIVEAAEEQLFKDWLDQIAPGTKEKAEGEAEAEAATTTEAAATAEETATAEAAATAEETAEETK